MAPAVHQRIVTPLATPVPCCQRIGQPCRTTSLQDGLARAALADAPERPPATVAGVTVEPALLAAVVAAEDLHERLSMAIDLAPGGRAARRAGEATRRAGCAAGGPARPASPRRTHLALAALADAHAGRQPGHPSSPTCSLRGVAAEDLVLDRPELRVESALISLAMPWPGSHSARWRSTSTP